MSVNDELFNGAIRRAIGVERFKASEVRRIIAFLNDQIFPDVIAQISRLEGLSPGTKRLRRRLAKVLAEISSIMRLGGRATRDRLFKSLSDFGLLEADFEAALLRSTAPPGLGLSIGSVNLPAIRAITRQKIRGRTLTQWFRSLTKAGAEATQAQINIGIAAGESVGQLIRRVAGTRRLGFADGVLQTTRRNAETIVRTSVNHVSTQARELVYAENSDLVKAVQIVATLDGRTTVICQGLDGEMFPVQEGPRPPFHMRCRTTTVPVLRSLKELGLSEADFPASTRASMNGQVPERQTYGEWLRRQPASIQNEALGPTRGQMFRDGRITVDRFTDPQHRPLTLDQLRVTRGM